MPKKIIETFNITKVFKLRGKNKSITALNNINMYIKEGEIFGLLGPNGAGKTTLIQILITLLQPTKGYALIDGKDIIKNPMEAKGKVSLMLDNKMLYYRITAYDNLKFFCKIYKVPYDREKIYNAAKFFGLENWLNQYVENFSSGMKMKLALCRTFLIDRPILFLDEPTLGLDVKLKNEIVDRIKKLNKTILLTSHDMSVVEKLCDTIAFINKGEIIKVGTKDVIKKFEHREIKINLTFHNNNYGEIISELKYLNYLIEVDKTDNGVLVSLKDRKYYQDFLRVLSNYQISKIEEKELNLENLFIKLNK